MEAFWTMYFMGMYTSFIMVLFLVNVIGLPPKVKDWFLVVAALLGSWASVVVFILYKEWALKKDK